MTLVTQSKYFDPIEDALVGEFQKELISFSQIEGKNIGIKNLPVSETEYRAYIMNHVETKTQVQIDMNHEMNTPVSGVVVANKAQLEAKEKIHILQASLTEDEHLLRDLQAQKKKHAPDITISTLRFWVNVGLVIISVAEGWFTFEAVRAAGMPKIPAFFTALATAISIGFGSHFLAAYINKAQTRLQKIIRYSIAIIPAFIFFCFLGSLRAQAYNQSVYLHAQVNSITSHTPGAVSHWSIAVISFLLFLTALLFSVYVHKGDKEAKRDQAYKKVCKEIAECVKRMKAAGDAIATIQMQAAAKTAEALGRYEYAIAVENRLQSIAKEAIEAFKNTNLRYRTDGKCPEFFSYPPSFKFRLFFDTVKKYQHENHNTNSIA